MYIYKKIWLRENLYVVGITRCQVQYGKYFPSFSYFVSYTRNEENMMKRGKSLPNRKRRKYLPILHEATCENYFIVKCLLKSNVARVNLLTYLIQFNVNLVEAEVASTNLNWLNIYLHVSVRILCTLFICFVLDGLLQWICFRKSYSKHSITFKNMYLLSC